MDIFGRYIHTTKFNTEAVTDGVVKDLVYEGDIGVKIIFTRCLRAWFEAKQKD
jgi:type I restriction enzyme R subunit